MKIALGSDHAGFKLKNIIKDYLEKNGYEVKDFGTNSLDSVDYPDFAYPCAKEVASKKADFGILVCYTGIGMSITANKVKGIRASLAMSVENAHLTREHNNANILCLGAKDINETLALDVVKEFLTTSFAGGRHERRVNKILEVEESYGK